MTKPFFAMHYNYFDDPTQSPDFIYANLDWQAEWIGEDQTRYLGHHNEWVDRSSDTNEDYDEKSLKLDSPGFQHWIDDQLDRSLSKTPHSLRSAAPGKKKEYPIGTVAIVTTAGRNFYFVAMSRLNDHGTAQSSLRDIEDALDGLWRFVAEQGELRRLVMPLMGTGRGRINLPRKKMVERIAQSFADASKDKIFSNQLVIVVRPQDADNFGVNLFEVRDYLSRSLHA